MITRGNYEIWFLDYFEGELSEEKSDMLFDFLAKNPDLKEEFYEFELIELPVEYVLMPDKNQLKKSLNIEKYSGLTDFEILAISQIEGTITPIQQIELDEIIKQSSEKAKQLLLFQKTVLQADTTVIFTDKNKLKHRTAFIPNWIRYSVSIAAAILLFFYVKNSITPDNTPPIDNVPTFVSDGQTEKHPNEKLQKDSNKPTKNKEIVATDITLNKISQKKSVKEKRKNDNRKNNAIVTPPFLNDTPAITIQSTSLPVTPTVTVELKQLPIPILALQIPDVTPMSIISLPTKKTRQNKTQALTPKEFIVKTIKKELDIEDIDTPDAGNIILASIEKTGLAETTYESTKSLTKKVFSFSVGSFSFRRIRH